MIPDDAVELPSPLSLRGKILIKNKPWMPPLAPGLTLKPALGLSAAVLEDALPIDEPFSDAVAIEVDGVQVGVDGVQDGAERTVAHEASTRAEGADRSARPLAQAESTACASAYAAPRGARGRLPVIRRLGWATCNLDGSATADGLETVRKQTNKQAGASNALMAECASLAQLPFRIARPYGK